ncbi:ABC transporter ATP-binding protein, partial [Streptomyces cellulosae]
MDGTSATEETRGTSATGQTGGTSATEETRGTSATGQTGGTSATEETRGTSATGQTRDGRSEGDAVVVTRGLTKRYRGGQLAVDGLHLTVPAGSVFGFLG